MAKCADKINGVYYLSTEEYVDTEWNEVSQADEEEAYYKCRMLNGGTCYKKYKPSVAALVLKRGAYEKMEVVG